jgi:hypothetical protein
MTTLIGCVATDCMLVSIALQSGWDEPGIGGQCLWYLKGSIGFTVN